MREEGTGAEQIVTKVLKNISSEKGFENSEEMRLRQIKGGNELTVTIGKKKIENNGVVDAELTAKLKKGLDLGKNETVKMLNILRKGKVKVEKTHYGRS